MDNIDQNTKELLDFLLNRVVLTESQEKQVSSLIVRDLSSKIDQLPTFENGIPTPISVDINNLNLVEFHKPKAAVNFLQKFTGNGSSDFKYLTHNWDAYVKSTFSSFSKFHNIIKKTLTFYGESYNLRYNSPELWKLVWGFLKNDDLKYSWSRYKLKVGYNKYLNDWMEQNPNKQPFEMPLSFIKEDLGQNQLINNKRLTYFEEVVDLFKHCIEFRDDDLYYIVKRIFHLSDYKLDNKLLETLRGRSFYTDTEIIENVLFIIASNIAARPAFPNVKISCKEDILEDEKILRMEILQEDSFSNRDIIDSKIKCESGKGDLGIIKQYLKGLCDFAVESRFRVNGEIVPLRLTYLMNRDLKHIDKNGIQRIPYDECVGFKYILTFYLYNKDKDLKNIDKNHIWLYA